MEIVLIVLAVFNILNYADDVNRDRSLESNMEICQETKKPETTCVPLKDGTVVETILSE